MLRWLVFILILVVVEIYSFQVVKTSFDSKWGQRIYLFVSILTALFIIVSIYGFDRRSGINRYAMTVIAIMLLVYIPKILITVLLLSEDIFRLGWGSVRHFVSSSSKDSFLPERRKFISRSILALAMIPFGSMLYGIWRGKYNFRVIKNTLFFDDLPEAFDGFTILQLSDIHCGSFDNHQKIKYGIELINEQKCDMMVFTGDLVNSRAEEMNDWLELFSSVQNPEFGKFSVMGNHDYGDYIDWPSDEARKKNLEAVKQLHPKIGFDLLLNEKRIIRRGDSTIQLIGVENWGKGHFQKYGDLKLASSGVSENEFKILLSHDPSHWDEKVQNNPLNYQLTMSGHTHGMQFGIEVPGFKWSPSKFMYPHWAGVYENKGRKLYVNRGFGYLAFPGRVGIWPEITLIELKRKSKSGTSS